MQDKLARKAGLPLAGGPEWRQGFGKLKPLHKETGRVQAAIDQEFEVIEAEDSR